MEIWKQSLGFVKPAINYDDMDWLHIGIGRERTGKSSLAWQTCKLIDPTFNVSRVAFNNPQMENLIATCEKGQAILYDEGQKGLYSREAMSANNKRFNKLLMKSAGLNLFMFINTPSFLSLDWYVRKHRAMSMTRTTWVPMWKDIEGALPNTEGLVERRLTLARGIFEFYDASKFDHIYKDQKSGALKFPVPTYVDTFPQMEKTDLEWLEYLKRKGVFMRADEDEENDLR